jgi:acetyl esterase/lipase
MKRAMSHGSYIVAAVFAAGCSGAVRGPASPMPPPPSSTRQPRTFALYDTPPKGWEHASQTELTEFWEPRHRMLRNVTVPTITAYLPEPARATGAAVVIAPGGGFLALSIDEEGADVARWLSDRGVAAFVVKYRLYETPPESGAFWDFFRKQRDLSNLLGEAEATADGQAALRKVESMAASFGVDPDRIGFLGFSAGGMIAISVAVNGVTRPAFVGAIYAPVRPNVVVPKDAPPLFAAIAANDEVFPDAAVSSYTAWRAVHRPVELHIYASGGHGFGMRPQGTTSDHWAEAFYAWLWAEGFLKRR